VVSLAKRLGIALTPGNFCETSSFEPVSTSRAGIYVSGSFQGPKDIPQAVIDSSAAASASGEILSAARNTLTKVPEIVPETDIVGERPRIGVFVCRCGINIAGVVDVPSVAEYARTLPYVEFTSDNLYSCSQDNQDSITQLIKEKNLNRIVVAACTPKTHEPLFQETLISAGLNKYLFEMANIRNHDSWVHKSTPELATQKAKDLIRSAVAKVALTQPLKEAELQVNQTALVIGGGIAGMAAADSLARQGYQTHIVEKSAQLGGQALNLYQTAKGENIHEKLSEMIASIHQNSRIQVHLNTTLGQVDGFVGNFKTTLSTTGSDQVVEHGIAVIATGASPYVPTEYDYGKDRRIITSLEFDKKLKEKDESLTSLSTAVFIQCVGSREPDRLYCSRVCCTHSIDNALELKEKNPDMNVYILYRDIRTYGEREYLYKKAREKGVIFIRYSLDNKPQVVRNDGKLVVKVTDHILGRPMDLEADLITLATAIVPNRDDRLAGFFKVPLNADGFFVERHAKLGPSEFATDGVFLCGTAHYPKPIDESIVQGKAAASRAVTLLARENIHTSGTIAEVVPTVCSSCGVCVSICPYSAPSFIEAAARFNPGKAQINPVLCKGCGLCVASCRSGAIRLKGFDNDQIFAQIFALNEAV
jgi:heterodisulfide reductase subunit A